MYGLLAMIVKWSVDGLLKRGLGGGPKTRESLELLNSAIKFARILPLAVINMFFHGYLGVETVPVAQIVHTMCRINQLFVGLGIAMKLVAISAFEGHFCSP